MTRRHLHTFRRERWPALVLTVAAVAVATVVGGCSPRPSSAAPSPAEVSALLTRHAAAVTAHSGPAFLRDVDSAPSSSAFRQRQAAQSAALAHVPLQSWRYAVEATVTEPEATAAATRRYGAKALVVHVTLSYALRSVDPAPSVHDLWWTFVRRHSRVVVAGDDDMADLGGPSWRGPWDFGPVVVQRGAHSLVLGHDAAVVAGLSGAVDAAVPVVSGVWGTDWTQQVAVVVPGSAAEFAALTGQGGALVDISAETVADERDPLTGVVTGQRVIVNPTTLGALTPVGRRIVLQHEITHVAAAAATGDALPRWVVEGFAEYVGNLDSGQPVPVAATELRADIRAGRLPATLPADAGFAPGAGGLAQRYEQSWLACRLIAARVGRHGLVTFYRMIGASPEAADAAVATALQSVLHESPAAFTSQWRAYLRTELA